MYYKKNLFKIVVKFNTITLSTLDVYEFTILLDRAKKGNHQLSVFSNRTDEASATQYFQVPNNFYFDIFYSSHTI